MNHTMGRKPLRIKIVSLSADYTEPLRHPASRIIGVIVPDPTIFLKLSGSLVKIVGLLSHIDTARQFLIAASQIIGLVILSEKTRLSCLSGTFSVSTHIPGVNPGVFLQDTVFIQITVFHPGSPGQKAFFIEIIGFASHGHKTFFHPAGLLVQIIDFIAQLQPAFVH